MSLLGSQRAEEFESSDEARFDWALILALVSLVGLGLINVYSATANIPGLVGVTSYDMALRQLMNLGIGLFVIGLIMLVDYRLVERVAYVIYGVNFFFLALVPIFGVVRYGARRWLNLGFMSYQPSETMKIATILALAKYFHNRSGTHRLDFKDLIKPGLILCVPGFLTITQPDLGTGGHLLISGTAILLFVGIRPRVLITGIIAAIVSFPVAWQYGLKPYQKDRIRTFIDPMADPKGEGYNALQSMIAVGSGQLSGKGFKQGTQTQLHFTPEGHTDFIFTVLAEEWGFLGALSLFGLYLFLMYRCVHIASLARDKFGSLVCVGIIGMIASQIAINIAMVCGMFPIVGIPLPLVSYGGTSVITVCASLGMLLNIGYRRTIF